jgi:1-deoxy-D-xylulose-5-phosphate synthase
MMIMAAADEAELAAMIKTATDYDHGPCAFRYPRGEATGIGIPDVVKPLEIGKGRILREGGRVALVSLGTRLGECLKAADYLAAHGVSTTVVDARFAKPLDEALLRQLAQNHEGLVTVEEGAMGGFGAFVLHFFAKNGLLDKGLKIRTLTLPDRYQDHDTQTIQYIEAGLDAASISACVFSMIGKPQSQMAIV